MYSNNGILAKTPINLCLKSFPTVEKAFNKILKDLKENGANITYTQYQSIRTMFNEKYSMYYYYDFKHLDFTLVYMYNFISKKPKIEIWLNSDITIYDEYQYDEIEIFYDDKGKLHLNCDYADEYDYDEEEYYFSELHLKGDTEITKFLLTDFFNQIKY